MAKTILIVDDSESIREVVSFTLENEGYNVLIAVDGKDGKPVFLVPEVEVESGTKVR